jgi:8-amino-7-oxononanoate synthase
MKTSDCSNRWDSSPSNRMPADFRQKLDCELASRLQLLGGREQLRSLEELRGVNLCSNDYLGLAEHPALKTAVAEAAGSALRVAGTGSRLLSGHDPAWTELEEEFAEFAGTEAALYFGSGYAANLGVLTALLGKDGVVFSDALNHASIVDGIRLSGARKFIYPHRDLDALERQLREAATLCGRKLIVTESVFSMDGDVAPLAELLVLAERHGAGLLVDEAHATAVHGPLGRGVAARERVTEHLVAIVHTCGKALASAGAFVCGSAVLKTYLINSARTLIFSTALPPYMAGQIRAAMHIALQMEPERDTLRANAAWLAQALRDAGWNTGRSTTQIVPAVFGDNGAALDGADFLQHSGFAVRAIRPPTVPEGTSRLRFSLTAAIPRYELERLVNAMQSWRDRRAAEKAVSCA